MRRISTKKVYGYGINDLANKCKMPIYEIWHGMLERCYDSKLHAKRPTYKDCTVCKEWQTLSNFWPWAAKHWKPGLCLDKDLIKPGNRIYCPEFCRFVTRALNSLLNNSRAARGQWPQGVDFHRGRFQAQCWVNGIRQYLGIFDTPGEAHSVYVDCKSKLILQAANEQTDERIANGLRKHAKLLRNSVT